MLDPDIMNKKPWKDLALRRVIKAKPPTTLFTSLLLGLVPQLEEGSSLATPTQPLCKVLHTREQWDEIYARLGWGLVVDDELSSGCASDAISEAEKGLRQPAISWKRRSERSRTERMWEPDKSQESKGVRGANGSILNLDTQRRNTEAGSMKPSSKPKDKEKDPGDLCPYCSGPGHVEAKCYYKQQARTLGRCSRIGLKNCRPRHTQLKVQLKSISKKFRSHIPPEIEVMPKIKGQS